MKELILRVFREAEEASVCQAGTQEAGRVGFRVIVVTLSTAICLTLTYYLSRDGHSLRAFAEWLGGPDWVRWIERRENQPLSRLLWWGSIVTLFYWGVPMLVVKAVLRERLSDYGFRIQGAFSDFRLYLVALGIALPLVWIVSASPGFLQRYPFYSPRAGEAIWPRLVIWEGVYLLQFIGVEFLFRGFLLHGTKARFGFYAVMAMIIPYCMVHFAKPLPETLASIVAGLVLGVFSLKSGSIWPGFLLHCGTALAMDFAALYRKGLLGQ